MNGQVNFVLVNVDGRRSNYTEQTNTLCGQNSVFGVERGGMRSPLTKRSCFWHGMVSRKSHVPVVFGLFPFNSHIRPLPH